MTADLDFKRKGSQFFTIWLHIPGGKSSPDRNRYQEDTMPPYKGTQDKPAPATLEKDDKEVVAKETGSDLLDELESFMDRSMAELDAGYNEEFSRLEQMMDEGSNEKSDVKAGQTDKMETKLKECETAIRILQERLGKSEEEAKTQCAAEIEALQNKLQAARRQMCNLRESGDEGWALVKEGLFRVVRDLTGAVKSSVARLRKANEVRH
jgi:exonuclease VII large subunit